MACWAGVGRVHGGWPPCVRNRTVAQPRGGPASRTAPFRRLRRDPALQPFGCERTGRGPALVEPALPLGLDDRRHQHAVGGSRLRGGRASASDRLWSAHDHTRKEHHRVVDSGPYRLRASSDLHGDLTSRHSRTSAIAQGSAIAVIGAAAMTYGFYYKARLEERFLTTGVRRGLRRRTRAALQCSSPSCRSRSSAD